MNYVYERLINEVEAKRGKKKKLNDKRKIDIFFFYTNNISTARQWQDSIKFWRKESGRKQNRWPMRKHYKTDTPFVSHSWKATARYNDPVFLPMILSSHWFVYYYMSLQFTLRITVDPTANAQSYKQVTTNRQKRPSGTRVWRMFRTEKDFGKTTTTKQLQTSQQNTTQQQQQEQFSNR